MIRFRWLFAALSVAVFAGPSHVAAQPKIVDDDAKVNKADGKIAKSSASFYISQKMYDEALEKLAIAVRGLPNDPEVHFLLGQLNNEKLREAMRTGGQDQEQRITTMNHHFDICLTLKKGEKKYGKKIQQMREYWWTEYYNLGIAAYNAADYGDALNGLQRSILVIPGKGVTYKMLGSTYQAMRQNEAAIESYRKAISLDSTDATAYANLAIALINTGSSKDAISYLQRAHELKPDDLQILQNLSMIQLQNDDKEGALKTAKKALENDPEDVNACRTAAQVYLMMQEYQEAANLFEKVREKDAEDTVARDNLAAAYLYLNQFDKAEGLFSETVKIDPTNFEAWYQLGVINDRAGKTKDALMAFEKVVELNPTDHQAWLALYRVYLTQSQTLEGPAAKEAVKKGEKAYEMAESLANAQE